MYYVYMGMSVSLCVCPYRPMHYGMCVHIHGCDCEHVHLYIYALACVHICEMCGTFFISD